MHVLIASTFWHPVFGDLRVYGWRLGGAMAVLLITVIAGRIVNSRVRSGLARTSVGPNPTVLIARSARAAAYFLGIVWILAICSVPFTALAAFVSVTALALSLSLQDLLKSLIAGIYLLAERPFHIGDRITVGSTTGVIDDIQMRATFLHSDQGERIVMPNQSVFTQVIVNNTVAGGHTTTLSLDVPRATTSEQIAAVVGQAIQSLPGVASHMRPKLEPVGATSDATRWQLLVWLPEGTSPSELIIALMNALPTATIAIG